MIGTAGRKGACMHVGVKLLNLTLVHAVHVRESLTDGRTINGSCSLPLSSSLYPFSHSGRI